MGYFDASSLTLNNHIFAESLNLGIMFIVDLHAHHEKYLILSFLTLSHSSRKLGQSEHELNEKYWTALYIL